MIPRRVTVIGDVVRELHMHLCGPVERDSYVEVHRTTESIGGAGAFAFFVLAHLGAEVWGLKSDYFCLKPPTSSQRSMLRRFASVESIGAS